MSMYAVMAPYNKVIYLNNAGYDHEGYVPHIHTRISVGLRVVLKLLLI